MPYFGFVNQQSCKPRSNFSEISSSLSLTVEIVLISGTNMSLYFPSFNYSSNINCCLSKHINHTQGKKKNPSFMKLPSSLIKQTDENPLSNISSPERNFIGPVNGLASNPIGIIGGVLVDSTSSFAKKLVNLNLENEGNNHPFVLCSDPALNKELLSRNSFPGKTESKDFDQSLLVENLRVKRMYLEKSGVCCIAMPCHVSHRWYDEIREGCSVPFLHMGECVAKELKYAKLRPLEAGSPLRIGVLATNETLIAGFYHEKLESEGFEVIQPDKATIEHIVNPAKEALSRKDLEGAQNLFRIALQVLLVRAVNRIVLACDDLQQLLPLDDPLWDKCIDPMDALARSALKYAQSTRR